MAPALHLAPAYSISTLCKQRADSYLAWFCLVFVLVVLFSFLRQGITAQVMFCNSPQVPGFLQSHDPPALSSQVPGPHACTTMSGHALLFAAHLSLKGVKL